MATITLLDTPAVVRFPAASVVTPDYSGQLQPQLIVAKFFDPTEIHEVATAITEVVDAAEVQILPFGFGILSAPLQATRTAKIFDPALLASPSEGTSSEPDAATILITPIGFQNIFERQSLLESEVTVQSLALDFLQSETVIQTISLDFLEADAKVIVGDRSYLEGGAPTFGTNGRSYIASDSTVLDSNLSDFMLQGTIKINVTEGLEFLAGETAPILQSTYSDFVGAEVSVVNQDLSFVTAEATLALELRSYLAGDAGEVALQAVGYLSADVAVAVNDVAFISAEVAVTNGSRSFLASETTAVNQDVNYLSAEVTVPKNSLYLEDYALKSETTVVTEVLTPESNLLRSESTVLDEATIRNYLKAEVTIQSAGAVWLSGRQYDSSVFKDPLFNQYVTGVID